MDDCLFERSFLQVWQARSAWNLLEGDPLCVHLQNGEITCFSPVSHKGSTIAFFLDWTWTSCTWTGTKKLMAPRNWVCQLRKNWKWVLWIRNHSDGKVVATTHTYQRRTSNNKWKYSLGSREANQLDRSQKPHMSSWTCGCNKKTTRPVSFGRVWQSPTLADI